MNILQGCSTRSVMRTELLLHLFSAMPECAFCISHSWQWEPAHRSQFLSDQSVCSVELSKKPFYYGQVHKKGEQPLFSSRMEVRDALVQKRGPSFEFAANIGSVLQLVRIYSLWLCEGSLVRSPQCSISCSAALWFPALCAVFPNPFWGSFYCVTEGVCT